MAGYAYAAIEAEETESPSGSTGSTGSGTGSGTGSTGSTGSTASSTQSTPSSQQSTPSSQQTQQSGESSPSSPPSSPSSQTTEQSLQSSPSSAWPEDCTGCDPELPDFYYVKITGLSGGKTFDYSELLAHCGDNGWLALEWSYGCTWSCTYSGHYCQLDYGNDPISGRSIWILAIGYYGSCEVAMTSGSDLDHPCRPAQLTYLYDSDISDCSSCGGWGGYSSLDCANSSSAVGTVSETAS